MDPLVIGHIVTTLFPSTNDGVFFFDSRPRLVTIPQVTVNEINAAMKRMKNNKAPGTDSIPSVAVIAAIKVDPNIFVSLFTKCLEEGLFPSPWKKQDLILLLKPGKEPQNPTSYRPICLLDELGKTLESVMVNCLHESLERHGGLSERQFGFRRCSVLGPALWNAMYDGVLEVIVPDDADDLAIVVVAKTIEKIMVRCSAAVEKVTSWLCENGLQLAVQKTEAVLLSTRRKREVFSFSSGGFEITSKSSLRCLGNFIDTRTTFRGHLRAVNEKAAKVTVALSRLMTNTSGIPPTKRKLLARLTSSVILYAGSIWVFAMRMSLYAAGAKSTYRLSALRVISAFRTVSDDAACVIAGMPPLDLLA
ncbi:uncharacterized protein LOC119688850 [Teleopsis dalmanni]|uniref:uncharacterized protein LOC119688850 n=1 Tax=Teleopsis dalmanni TaxID=139649 RepID=UPI0018CD6EC4|nr:uncharacterized protein LOC119688850 [Teleopsis dalmanni]